MAETGANRSLDDHSRGMRLLRQLNEVFVLMTILPVAIGLVMLVSLLHRLSLHAPWVRKRSRAGSRSQTEGDEPERRQQDIWRVHSPKVVKSYLSLLLYELMSMLLKREKLMSMVELRNRHYLVFDLLALSLMPAIALTIRVEDLRWWPTSGPALLLYTCVSVCVKIGLFYAFGLYGRYWPYASVRDLSRLLLAVGYSTVVLTALFIAIHDPLRQQNLALSRTIPLVDGMLTILAAGSLRFGMRGFYDWFRQQDHRHGGQRVLIVGAGAAGMMTVREIYANRHLMLEPVGFIDDDVAKLGAQVCGLPVLGTTNNIPEVVNLYHIQRIIVATPSAPLPRQTELADICRQTGVATDTLPGVYQILAGHKTISPLPQIDINRILGRDPITVDLSPLSQVIPGTKVMITGAGGSIGSELCRQIAGYQPAELILLGHGENSIFEIALDLKLRFPELKMCQVIADVRDNRRIHWAVRNYQPAIIFHAAAHKHVPFMEENVVEAVTNNVLGTRNVLQAAEAHDVQHFILISSDKAINPANVMGVTKRIAELMTLAVAQRTGRAFMTVRFGNVLGSRGSVIPVFQRQISAGGPVTVTHADMYRYFMTIPEAVSLVLLAAALGRGGEVFVLDMGEPVSILDLAIDLIRLSGMEPGRDIDIVQMGVRPGEKLREELFFTSETYWRSDQSEKLCVAIDQSPLPADMLEGLVERLLRLAAEDVSPDALIKQMQSIVPEYQPNAAGSARTEINRVPASGAVYAQPYPFVP